MTRKLESFLKRVLDIATAIFAILALGLLGQLLFAPATSQLPEFKSPQFAALKPAGALNADARATQLADVKMSKTITPNAEGAKGPIPELSSLVRLVGVLSYGDPKDNEALIEVLRTKQTQSFRVGDRIPGVNAVITKIDTAVTLDYNGKSARLEIKNNDQAEAGQLALPEEQTGLAIRGR